MRIEPGPPLTVRVFAQAVMDVMKDWSSEWASRPDAIVVGEAETVWPRVLADLPVSDVVTELCAGKVELVPWGGNTHGIVGIYTYGPDNKLTSDVVYQPGELE
mgnify:CR=1 FL=1